MDYNKCFCGQHHMETDINIYEIFLEDFKKLFQFSPTNKYMLNTSFHYFLYFTKRKPLQKYEKYFLFHLTCSFHDQDIQIICNIPLSCPRFQDFRRKLKAE